MFGSKSRTLRQQNSRFFFHQLVLHSLYNVVYNCILLMHKTYRASIFNVLLQLKDLISENMKYPNKVKIVGKGGCIQHDYSKKRAR